MKYSQNNEEMYILDYFKRAGISFAGFLDIGAYDGVNLSNTRALANLGWYGLCVEPSPTVFEKLKENYKHRQDVKLLKKAIGTESGKLTFYNNDNAVATLVKEETNRWPEEVFDEVEVEVITFNQLQNSHPFPYKFISIDAEGLDYEILKQIDLNAVGCHMICVEHNGKTLEECRDYVLGFGFRVVHVNAENLLMERE